MSHFCLDLAWIGDPVCAKTTVGVTLLLRSGLDRRPCVCKDHGRCHTFAWMGLVSLLVDMNERIKMHEMKDSMINDRETYTKADSFS